MNGIGERMPESVGERLKRAMESKGASISWLASETGIARSTIYGMREGTCTGNLHSWMEVAAALGVSLSELIGDDDG